MWSKVRIGSNTVFGTACLRTSLTVRGARLLGIAWQDGRGLSISGDLHDDRGCRWGVVHDNAWRTNARDGRVETKPEGGVIVTDAQDGPVVLEAEVRDSILTIVRMKLRSRDGAVCNLDAQGVLTVTTPMQSEPKVIVNQLVLRTLDSIDLTNDFTKPGGRGYTLLDALGTSPAS